MTATKAAKAKRSEKAPTPDEAYWGDKLPAVRRYYRSATLRELRAIIRLTRDLRDRLEAFRGSEPHRAVMGTVYRAAQVEWIAGDMRGAEYNLDTLSAALASHVIGAP